MKAHSAAEVSVEWVGDCQTEKLAVPRPIFFGHNFSQWPSSPCLPTGPSLILTPWDMLRWSSLFCLWQQAYHSQISHINHIYAGIQSGFCYYHAEHLEWLLSDLNYHLYQNICSSGKKNVTAKLSFSLILVLEHFWTFLSSSINWHFFQIPNKSIAI